jgi:hypothetical protein
MSFHAVLPVLGAFLLRAAIVLGVAALAVLSVAIMWAINFVYIAPIGDKLHNLPGPSAGRFESHMNEVRALVCVRGIPDTRRR